MEKARLTGCSILIVEDEPLIALDIVDCFKKAGASVLGAQKLEDGLRLAGHPDLSAAVVDFGRSDGEGTALCERLTERGIPFVLHSGYSHVHDACRAGVTIPTCYHHRSATPLGRDRHMSSLTNHIAKTEHRVRALTQRIDLYRNRVARRSRNSALAEQANRLLPAMSAQLDELARYRKRPHPGA